MKISTALSIAGVILVTACAWNAGGEDTSPPQPPSLYQEVNPLCTPVAVPLYQNGTDCESLYRWK